MEHLNVTQYSVAVQGWAESKQDLRKIYELFPVNSVFTFSYEQIEWLRKNNSNTEFCAEIGVLENRLVLMLCPLDGKGNKVDVVEFPYSYFEKLTQDIRLTQTQTYTVVKTAILSQDFRDIDDDSDVFLPVVNKPIMDQDEAVKDIESWQNNGQDWFYAEFNQNGSKNIFNKFYVPASKISGTAESLSFVCAFGLKFSEVYQKVLPALIFISFHKNLGGSTEEISNTYDWSKPCPPVCKIPVIFE